MRCLIGFIIPYTDVGRSLLILNEVDHQEISDTKSNFGDMEE